MAVIRASFTSSLHGSGGHRRVKEVSVNDHRRALVETWIKEHGKAIQEFLSRRISTKSKREDVLQSVMEKLMRVPYLELVKDPVAYLIIALRNEHFSMIRAEKRRSRRIVELAFQDIDELASGDSLSDGHEVVIQQEKDRNTIFAALKAAHPEIAYVLILRWEHGLSIEEIGKLCKVSSSTVKRMINRGIAFSVGRYPEVHARRETP